MDKVYLHRNGCVGKWEIYQGQTKPVCGEGGFATDENGKVRQWDRAEEACWWAADNLTFTTMLVAGIRY